MQYNKGDNSSVDGTLVIDSDNTQSLLHSSFIQNRIPEMTLIRKYRIALLISTVLFFTCFIVLVVVLSHQAGYHRALSSTVLSQPSICGQLNSSSMNNSNCHDRFFS